MALFELREHSKQRGLAGIRYLTAWTASAFYAERGRWFLWAPDIFSLGIAAYFKFPIKPPTIWCIVITAVVLSLHMSARATRSSVSIITGVLLIATLGLTTAKLRTERVAAPVLPVALKKAVVSGRIVALEGRVDRGQRLWLDVGQIEDLPADLTPVRIIVYQRKRVEELSIGDNIRLTADLRPPSRPARPGGFDFARQNYFDRIGAIAFTARPIEMETDAKALPPLSRTERLTLGLAEFRRRIGERIERALPGEVGAIAKALMTGERRGISEKTNEAYRDAGIFHILSISGLHMAIMGGSVFIVIRFVLAGIPAIALRWQIKKWAAAAAAIAAFGYLLISGGANATIRSFFMILIMFLAVLVDRPAWRCATSRSPPLSSGWSSRKASSTLAFNSPSPP